MHIVSVAVFFPCYTPLTILIVRYCQVIIIWFFHIFIVIQGESKEAAIEASHTDDITTIKDIIHRKLGFEPRSQQLLHHGKTLHNDDIISSLLDDMFQVELVLSCHEKISIFVKTMVHSKPVAARKATKGLGNSRCKYHITVKSILVWLGEFGSIYHEIKFDSVHFVPLHSVLLS